jgi:hypothetical protein
MIHAIYEHVEIHIPSLLHVQEREIRNLFLGLFRAPILLSSQASQPDLAVMKLARKNGGVMTVKQ